MKISLAMLATVGLLASATLNAQSGADVIKTKGCAGCHDVDKKKVGPSFREIATKHKGNKDAEAALVAKLKEGKGHPKAAASDAELKAAVRTVLATK